IDFDPVRVIPDDSKSLAEGAIAPWARGDKKLVRETLQSLSRSYGIDLTMPFGKLPRKSKEVLLFGPRWTSKNGNGFEGLLPNLHRRYEEGSWAEQEELEPYRSLRPCPTCRGHRLKTQSLSVKVKGRGMADYVDLPIAEALRVFETMT